MTLLLTFSILCTTVQYQHSLITWQQPGGHPDLVVTVRDRDKPRGGHEIGGPSRFHIRVTLDDGYDAASNPQGRLVLGPSLIMMERGLVPIQNLGVVAEGQVNEIPQSEQNDPEDLKSLFEYGSGHLVLPVRPPFACLSRTPLPIV